MKSNKVLSICYHITAFAILSLMSIKAFSQDRPACMGTTKAGKPCQASPGKASTYCRLHDPKAIHCSAIKKDGTQCRMVVKKTGDKCHVHKG